MEQHLYALLPRTFCFFGFRYMCIFAHGPIKLNICSFFSKHMYIMPLQMFLNFSACFLSCVCLFVYVYVRENEKKDEKEGEREIERKRVRV